MKPHSLNLYIAVTGAFTLSFGKRSTGVLNHIVFQARHLHLFFILPMKWDINVHGLT